MQTTLADILVVDDNAVLRNLLSDILSEFGHDVRAAEDGVTALRCIQERVPEILITDLNMPFMSGFELIRLVRYRFTEVAVVAMSGALSAADLSPGVVVDDFYPKGSGSILPLLKSIDRLSGIKKGAKRCTDFPIWNSSIPRDKPHVRVLP